jgi:hypothetical protein
VNAPAHLAAVPAGERVAVIICATSQRQARVVHRYVSAFLHSPALAGLVESETQDEVRLTNGVVVMTLPAHAASVRGEGAAVVILDEAAWFTGLDGSPLDVGELWRALVPATAAFPERRVLVLSTPRWSTDWFARLCERADRGDDPTLRQWHASTAEMNPSIAASFLAGEEAADPEAFRREYLAEFVSGVGAALDAELVRAAATGEMRPAEPDRTYVLAIDPAFTGDRFAALIGHREDARLIVDRVASWGGSRGVPVRLDATLDELADLSRLYNGARVVTDQYAAEPIRQGLQSRGLAVEAKPWTNESKSDALTILRRSLYQDALTLPRHAGLVSELVSLETRPTPSGRPRIAAPGRGHDDYATCLLALVAELGDTAGPAVGGTVEPETGVRRISRQIEPTARTHGFRRLSEREDLAWRR